MACLADATLIAHNEGSLGAIESAQARDHLLLCPDCRRSAAAFRALDMILATPTLHTPPARLIPQVMERIYPALPRITSIAAMLAASVLFLITWIYIYFDFSSSSLIQALRLTTDGTSGWLIGVIKAISAVYSGTQAAVKAGSALLNIFLPAPLVTVVFAASLLGASTLLASTLLKPWLKRTRAKRS
jgi:hypothetical protein